jgi:hypothetical protein
MSIFAKPTSQLETAELMELLNDGAVENVRLEFKLEAPSKDETLKKLSSFANTFGGFMVIGASASSHDGRIQGLPGVDVQPGFKQKVVQWCFEGASPPLTVEVSDPIPAPSADGKVCYVIYTSESDVAPHFLNGRKGIWVRTDEFSARFEARLATESELRQLLDRRKQILERRTSLLERARRRFDTYALETHPPRVVRGTSDETKAKVGALLEFSVVPRFPARPICEQAGLKQLILKNRLVWRGVEFPRYTGPAVSQHESEIMLKVARDFSLFEANIWGMLFYGTQIDGDHSGTLGIHLYEFVGTVMVFIRHAGTMLQAMGYSGPILVETTLNSILGVQWLQPAQSWLTPMSGSQLDDHVAFPIETTSDALRGAPDAVAMDVLRYVFFAVNLPDLGDTSEKLEALVRMGYRFNYWSDPVSLLV